MMKKIRGHQRERGLQQIWRQLVRILYQNFYIEKVVNVFSELLIRILGLRFRVCFVKSKNLNQIFSLVEVQKLLSIEFFKLAVLF